MIDSNSPFHCLPVGLERKCALFLDGIRHAAEFVSAAYDRLRDTLTRLALEDVEGQEARQCSTAAFIDAWTIIDAFHRFRLLVRLYPATSGEAVDIGTSEIVNTARRLRNVADHLAENADMVVASNGTALGVLSWFTVSDLHTGAGQSCLLIPGIMPPGMAQLVNPATCNLQVRTDLIHLAAGGYRISLTELVMHMTSTFK